MISAVSVRTIRMSRLLSASEYSAPNPRKPPPFVSIENLVIDPVRMTCTPRSRPISAAWAAFTRPVWPRFCSASTASSWVRSTSVNLPLLKSWVTSSSAAAYPRLSPQKCQELLFSKCITATRTLLSASASSADTVAVGQLARRITTITPRVSITDRRLVISSLAFVVRSLSRMSEKSRSHARGCTARSLVPSTMPTSGRLGVAV